jgi:monoamine oxidase
MLAEGESRVEGGMSALPQELAKGLLEADALAFDCAVERISVGEDSVTVHYSRGRSMTARFAVCAVPFNALYKIEFQPVLPLGVAAASQRGHAGHPKKVWADAGMHPAEQPGLSLRYEKLHRECLISTTSADNADDAGDGADAMTGGSSHDWSKNELFRGAWLAPRPGMHAALQALRDVTEGRMLFAGGDIAPVWPGWAEGAVASGNEAAARFLSSRYHDKSRKTS